MTEWKYVCVNTTHINKLKQLRVAFVYYYVMILHSKLTDQTPITDQIAYIKKVESVRRGFPVGTVLPPVSILETHSSGELLGTIFYDYKMKNNRVVNCLARF